MTMESSVAEATSYANDTTIDSDSPVNISGTVNLESGASASIELARSLPELVDQLCLLRMEIEKKTAIYDSVILDRASRSGGNGGGGGGNGVDTVERPSERQSLFTPFASPDLDMRMSQQGYSDEPLDIQQLNHSGYRSSSNWSLHPQNGGGRPSLNRSNSRGIATSASMSIRNCCDYSVMWVSGECGISLRNFSPNKIGAQIAVLQQADGVTTGISNCRLGDQLMTINDDRVDDFKFRDIVQKLKNTRRPISLGFRTNQNVQTSPRAASARPKNSRARAGNNNLHNSSGRHTMNSNQRQFLGGATEEDEYTSSSRSGTAVFSSISANGELGADMAVTDRQTTTSVRSSTSTLSDDVEIWCKEQEEMHSDIIVLLTETIMRCEKLQQENLDQLQSLMQLAPQLYSNITEGIATATTTKSTAAGVDAADQ